MLNRHANRPAVKCTSSCPPGTGGMRMSGENDMLTRAVLINVKSGCEVELTRTFEQEVIPRFRKEKDFRGLLAFTVPYGTEAQTLVFQRVCGFSFFIPEMIRRTSLSRTNRCIGPTEGKQRSRSAHATRRVSNARGAQSFALRQPTYFISVPE